MNGNTFISNVKAPSSDFKETYGSSEVFEEIERLKANGEVFYIPLIKLIGYGKKQTFQCVCLKCKENYFNLERVKSFSDLFCSFCTPDPKWLTNENVASTNYVGIIVGWEVKSASDYKKRSFYNYTKVYKRDEYTCQYCNYNLRNCAEFRALHIDHIKPWSAGGSNSMNNLVVACDKCNTYASNKWFNSFYEKKKHINQHVPEIFIMQKYQMEEQ